MNMDFRSAKVRSLGLNPGHTSSNVSKRPGLGERHQSAPTIPRIEQGCGIYAAEGQDDLVTGERGSGVSSRRGSLSQPLSNAGARKTSMSMAHGEHLVLKLVVIGNPRTGKSSFIKSALDLRKHSPSPVSSNWVSINGSVHRVQIVELNLEDVEIQRGNRIVWPDSIDDLTFSPPDAVIYFCDAVIDENTRGMISFLTAAEQCSIPIQVLSSFAKPAIQNCTDTPNFLFKLEERFPNISVIEPVSEGFFEQSKKYMLVALKAILSLRAGAMLPTNLNLPSHQTRHPTHSPSASDQTNSSTIVSKESSKLSVVAELAAAESDVESVSELERMSSMDRTKTLARLQTFDFKQPVNTARRPQTPVSDTGPYAILSTSPDQKRHTAVPETPESYSNSFLNRPGTAGTADSLAHHTFFHGGEDDSPTADHQQQLNTTSPDKVRSPDNTPTDPGVPFSDLVDRLLQLPKTKSDARFVPAFLCLYRVFATPMLLLVEIIDRFARTDSSEMIQFDKIVELLRYLQVMATWTAVYPGDFADSSVHELATTFVHDIRRSRSLALAAKEISNNLQVVVEDEDQDWAYSNLRKVQMPHKERQSSELISKASWSTDTNVVAGDNANENGIRGARSSTADFDTLSKSPSLTKPDTPSSQSAAKLSVLRHAREQARRFNLTSEVSLSKIHWHLFMESSSDELARELTRIDHLRYLSIRPRDFVREACIPEGQRKDSTISLMIRHFNHVSYFIASMILLRDKAKHRAKTVEKVMDLAWKVRQLNNYNAVNAIVAGMQNTAITRLGQTMELVPPETQRQFMRLNVLVDSARSYATYRMAWDNTFSERIPLIPSLLRDLKMAMLANQTFVGSNICWKKFEIMGDAVVGIERSQELRYSFPEGTARSNDVLKLFLEVKVIDDADDSADPSKELYDRSKRIEPQTVVNDSKKKFDWLRR